MPDVTPLPKKVKKPSRAAATKKCDELFSLLVRARDRCCVICGSTSFLQCAHGFSRSYHAVRWDFRNAWALCRACHVRYTHRPLEWGVWLNARWGDALEAEVKALALTHRKPDVFELKTELAEMWQQVAA